MKISLDGVQWLRYELQGYTHQQTLEFEPRRRTNLEEVAGEGTPNIERINALVIETFALDLPWQHEILARARVLPLTACILIHSLTTHVFRALENVLCGALTHDLESVKKGGAELVSALVELVALPILAAISLIEPVFGSKTAALVQEFHTPFRATYDAERRTRIVTSVVGVFEGVARFVRSSAELGTHLLARRLEYVEEAAIEALLAVPQILFSLLVGPWGIVSPGFYKDLDSWHIHDDSDGQN